MTSLANSALMRGIVGIFLALPTRCCIAHAENGERRQPRVEIGAEFALGDAFPDHLLENALKAARPAADAPAAFGGQMLALVEEDLDEIAAVDERGEVRIDQ